MSSELRIRVRTAIIIALVMIAFLLPGYWLPFIPLMLFLMITYISALEKGRAITRRLPKICITETAIISTLIAVPMFFAIPDGWFVHGIPEESAFLAAPIVAPSLIAVFALILLVVCSLWILISALRKGVEQLPVSVFEVFIIITTSVPMAAIITLLYGIPDGYFWLLLAIITPWFSDTFSYFIGNLFGQRKMAGKISGKKTWEGTLGGIIATWVLYLLYFTLLLGPRLNLTSWVSISLAVVSGLVMSLISTAGDLFASAVKRWSRIKDFGSILPGHGGITDRFDSMAWSIPSILILALLTHIVL